MPFSFIVSDMDLRIECTWHTRIRKEQEGKILLYTKDIKVGHIKFSVLSSQINVDDLRIFHRYRRRGLGRLLMGMVMSMATDMRKPVFLYSTLQSEAFYKKLGMRPIFHHESWKDARLTILNHNPNKELWTICSDLDLVWIPPNMREIQLWI